MTDKPLKRRPQIHPKPATFFGELQHEIDNASMTTPVILITSVNEGADGIRFSLLTNIATDADVADVLSEIVRWHTDRAGRQ